MSFGLNRLVSRSNALRLWRAPCAPPQREVQSETQQRDALLREGQRRHRYRGTLDHPGGPFHELLAGPSDAPAALDQKCDTFRLTRPRYRFQDPIPNDPHVRRAALPQVSRYSPPAHETESGAPPRLVCGP